MPDYKEDKRHRFYTEGPILKAIIFLTIPIIIGNLLQTAYQITDAFWVGRLGKEAVAAVSISFPINFLIISLSGGIGLAGGVLISQYKGKREHEKVDHISGQTFLMAFTASFLFSILGFISAPGIIKLFNPEQAVFNNALIFLRISFSGLVFVFGYMVYQSLSRAVGEARVPVFIVFSTVLLNFILDPLFIYGWRFIPAMGVGGAAMATLFTQMTALLVGLIILSRGKTGIHLKVKNLMPDLKVMKRIILLGIPISLEQSSRSLGFIIMSVLAASFGTVVLASYGIGTQMIGLVIIPALSISIANSALVGRNIGAGKIKRSEKIARTSMIVSFVFLTLIGILFFSFAEKIISIFISSDDTEVINEGAHLLKIVSLSFGFIGIQMTVLGALRGSGNAKTTLFIASSVVFVQVLTAFFLSKVFLESQNGIWYAFPISNIFGAGVAFFIFSKGYWKNRNLLERIEVKKEIRRECDLAECE